MTILTEIEDLLKAEMYPPTIFNFTYIPKRNLKHFKEIENSGLTNDPSSKINRKLIINIDFSQSWDMLRDAKTGEPFTKMSTTVF
jgi:hypothetical protein